MRRVRGDTVSKWCHESTLTNDIRIRNQPEDIEPELGDTLGIFIASWSFGITIRADVHLSTNNDISTKKERTAYETPWPIASINLINIPSCHFLKNSIAKQ